MPYSAGRLAQVVQDRVGAGDGLLVLPRLELVAEGVQVGIGANAGVAEQIPGAAGGVARFEDRERLVGLLGGERVRRPDTGDAGADDQHVDVLGAVGDRCRGHICGLLVGA